MQLVVTASICEEQLAAKLWPTLKVSTSQSSLLLSQKPQLLLANQSRRKRKSHGQGSQEIRVDNQEKGPDQGVMKEGGIAIEMRAFGVI